MLSLGLLTACAGGGARRNQPLGNSSADVSVSAPKAPQRLPSPVMAGVRSGNVSAGQMDVRTSVSAALVHSPKLRRAQADLAAAGVDVDIAYTGYQPVVESSAGIGADSDYDFELTLNQPLFDWGHTAAEVGAAKSERVAAQAEYEDVRGDVALEAAAAHIDIKRTEEMVAICEGNLATYRRFEQLARQRLEGGVADSSEIKLASVRMGEAEAVLADAQGALRDARSKYFLQVGSEPEGLAEVSELPLPLEGTGSVGAAVAQAPAVRAALAREEAARNAITSSQTELLPRLSAEAYVRGDEQEDHRTGVGLRVAGPTLRGLSAFKQVEAARMEASSARWAAEAARREATVNVQELLDREPTLRSRIFILSGELKQALTLRGLYEDQFAIGERSFSDLVSVQADIFRIQRDLITARYDILNLQYAAAAALGKLLGSLQLDVVEVAS